MAGFDSRIVGAMLSLGYRIFPFDAYDASGNLKVPGSVDFPPDVDAGLSRIASNPLWADLYRTMSPLGSHHKCFMAGVGFVNERVQVTIFKNTATVGSASEAMNWAESYHGTVEETLHRYAGTSYLVDPAWAQIIDKARGSLPQSERDVVMPGSEDVGDIARRGGHLTAADDDAPPSDDELVEIAAIPWLSFALDILYELITKVRVRTKVLTTVVWYPPSGTADQPFASQWLPIHATLQKGFLSGHRSAHLIWNANGLPVVWWGQSVAWKGAGMDMPAEPYQWCQALRPTANCTGRPIAETDIDAQPVDHVVG